MSITDDQCALVTATFSRQMTLQLDNGTRVRARIKGKLMRPVCGDRVRALPLDDEPEWLIVKILPRHNELTRPDSRGKTEVLAANLTLIAVVVAESPPADWYLVDRYLAAAENMSIPALVIFNKTDLAEPSDESHNVLAEYQELGYETIACSAKIGTDLGTVRRALQNRISIIVGQSGVGKSSLINSLIGGDTLRVAAISASTGEGKHTTVNSSMLSLPAGGAVIDSPGVRDFAPAITDVESVIAGFREIAARGQRCRFANCKHLREPECAVKLAVENGELTARRLESYKRLLSLSGKLSERY